MSDAAEVIVWGRTTSGKTARMGRRTAAHVDYTIARLAKAHPGAKLHIIQSAYNTGVPASAGTHDKDGCLDVSIEGLGWDDSQRFLRECGWAAWHRFPPAFGHHIHMISLGCPGPLGVFVPGQITDYYHHALGLKGQHNSGADHSWFPPNIDATIFDYPAWKESNEMTPDQAQKLDQIARNSKAAADDAAQARELSRRALARGQVNSRAIVALGKAVDADLEDIKTALTELDDIDTEDPS